MIRNFVSKTLHVNFHDTIVNSNGKKCPNLSFILYINCVQTEYKLVTENDTTWINFNKQKAIEDVIKEAIRNNVTHNFNALPLQLPKDRMTNRNSFDVSAHKDIFLSRTRQAQCLHTIKNPLLDGILPYSMRGLQKFRGKFRKLMLKFIRQTSQKKNSIRSERLNKIKPPSMENITSIKTAKYIRCLRKYNNAKEVKEMSRFTNVIRKMITKDMLLMSKRLIDMKLGKFRLQRKVYKITTEIRSRKTFDALFENNESSDKKDITSNVDITMTLNDSSEMCNIEDTKIHEGEEEIDTLYCGSEWSDWSYHSKELETNGKELCDKNLNKYENRKHYDFLPRNLNNLLLYGSKRLLYKTNIETYIKKNILDSASYGTSRRQDLDVRHCAIDTAIREFTLERKSVALLEAIGQINFEFIAALTVQDNKEILILIDQHAIDERIRYESILRRNGFVSVDLVKPIIMEIMKPRVCQILLDNPSLLKQFGIRLQAEDNYSLRVISIPKCLAKRRYYENDMKVFMPVRNLLLELAENLITVNKVSIMPLTIRQAVATEACHGAVKFGDPLTLEQCQTLVESLKDTSAPNRCAHGRPSLIPLLVLSDFTRQQPKQLLRKLNFASLTRTRKSMTTGEADTIML